MSSANTEYKLTMPAGYRTFKLKARAAVDIRYAYESGRVAAPQEPFATVKSGTVMESKVPGNTLSATESGQSIYLAAASATFAEFEFWL